jgi:hypothetical protein
VAGRLVGVIGASGAGKSSLVRAGLLPALASGFSPGTEDWPVALCTPGLDPIGALAAAFGTERPRDGRPLDAWFATSVRGLLADRHPASRAVVVIDQFEELFSLSDDTDDVHALLDVLAEATVGALPVVVVAVLRADHYGRTTLSPAFGRAMTSRHVLVGPMTESELRQAIRQPAHRAGLRLEPRLLDAVLADAADQPGALPLLSTALSQTWEHREETTLTLAAYLQAGRVSGALAKLADSVYSSAGDDEQRAMRSLLLRMVSEQADTVPSRRPAVLAELRADPVRVRSLELLAAQRLVTIGDHTAEITHDALLTNWPELRAWLRDDREGRELQRAVADRAQQWESQDRDRHLLERGPRLAAALQWSEEHPGEFTAPERTFLEASADAQRDELVRTRRTARLFRSGSAALAVLLVVAVIAAVLAVRQSRTARDQTDLANVNAASAARSASAAQVRALAAQSQAEVDGDLSLSLLLGRAAAGEGEALAAGGADPPPELAAGRAALVTALQHTGHLVRYLHDDPRRRHAVAFALDDHRLAAGGDNGTVAFWDLDGAALLHEPSLGHDPRYEVQGLGRQPGRAAPGVVERGRQHPHLGRGQGGAAR